MLNMTYFDIVALYTGISLIILVVLSLRVGMVRISAKVNMGDGGNAMLARRMRAQGNFVEYTPFFLIGLIAMAFLNAGTLWMHLAGIIFLSARLAHAYAMTSGNLIARPIGMLGSFLVLLGQAGFLIISALT